MRERTRDKWRWRGSSTPRSAPCPAAGAKARRRGSPEDGREGPHVRSASLAADPREAAHHARHAARARRATKLSHPARPDDAARDPRAAAAPPPLSRALSGRALFDSVEPSAPHRGSDGLPRDARRRERPGHRDRYHSRELTTPSEVRRALVYVLQNVRKHGFTLLGPFIDPLTTAKSFTGWTTHIDPEPDPFPPRTPRTWLLGEGWSSRGGGLLSACDRPA